MAYFHLKRLCKYKFKTECCR